MAYATTVRRHKTREVGVGDHVVGGDQPIWVQSMTTTNTFDVEATLEQIHRLEEAGCEIVRVTVPKKEDVEACQADPRPDQDPADRRHPLRLPDGPGLPRRGHAVGPAGRRQDPDQPRQYRRRGAVQGGRPQGARQGHPDAHRGQLGQPGEGPDRQVRLPLPRGDGRERPAVHRDGRAAGLSRDHRQPQGQPRARRPSSATPSTPRRATIRPTSGSPRPARASTARSRAPRASARSCSAGSATRSASRSWAIPCPRSPPASTSSAPATAA